LDEWLQLIIGATKKKGGSRHLKKSIIILLSSKFKLQLIENNCNSINRFQSLPGRLPEERVPPHPQISQSPPRYHSQQQQHQPANHQQARRSMGRQAVSSYLKSDEALHNNWLPAKKD
jgi:hypothetical protein